MPNPRNWLASARSRRTIGASLTAVGLCIALAAGCSSGSSHSSTPESLAPADQTAGTSCPFSGTTATTQGAGAGTSAVISDVKPAKSGCIDNVTAMFSTPPPAWTVGYQSGPFVDAKTGQAVSVPGPATLVVSFSATTYPGLPGGTTPAKIDPGSLDYVTSVTVITGPAGSLEWLVSLPSQMQYTTSVSNVPSEFVLGVG